LYVYWKRGVREKYHLSVMSVVGGGSGGRELVRFQRVEGGEGVEVEVRGIGGVREEGEEVSFGRIGEGTEGVEKRRMKT